MNTPIKQHQTKLHTFDQFGNCVPTAVASMLGMSVDNVPPFEVGYWCDGYDWREAVNSWLQKIHNLKIEYHWTGDKDDDDKAIAGPPPNGYSIAVGRSPRGLGHVVVLHDGILWSDPHPDETGLVHIEYYLTFSKWKIVV